jgi:flagellar biosynthesis chaperone FliJ
MPFRYRLQKALDFRIRAKEQQLQVVIIAQQEVYKVEQMIDLNNKEIVTTKTNMRKANPMMYEAYDNFLKSLYDKSTQLEELKIKALEKLQEEKQKLQKAEKDVKVLEKHKERMREIYIEEEKAAELKRLSEVAVQRFFARRKEELEEIEREERRKKDK